MYLPRSHDLVPRYYCSYNRYTGGYTNCHSNWYRWGRWALAGILIFVAILFLLALACFRRRRRRSRYMTSQAPMTSPQRTGAYYNQGPYNLPSGPPQPTYGAPQNEYYGQQSGVAPPGQAYQPAYK